MVTDEAAALQLLESQQGHGIRFKLRDAVSGSRPQVEAVKADATREIHVLIGVFQRVPCVATVFWLSQLFPDITNTGWKTHTGYLNTQRLLPYTGPQMFAAAKLKCLQIFRARRPFFVTACSNANLRIPQVGVSSKQDVDVIRRLSHLLEKQLQLSHTLSCAGLEALHVGRHETKLLASEQHLIAEEMCGYGDETNPESRFRVQT